MRCSPWRPCLLSCLDNQPIDVRLEDAVCRLAANPRLATQRGGGVQAIWSEFLSFWPRVEGSEAIQSWSPSPSLSLRLFFLLPFSLLLLLLLCCCCWLCCCNFSWVVKYCGIYCYFVLAKQLPFFVFVSTLQLTLHSKILLLLFRHFPGFVRMSISKRV